jgi:nitrile hydratase accessory protein
LSAPEVSRFDEAWQAQIFAITTLLHERGLFTWDEWTKVLGAELEAGPQVAGNDVYFSCWLNALEKILVVKGITDEDALADLAEDWREAAAHTPHGQPIVLGTKR